jgi:hypothetical protein
MINSLKVLIEKFSEWLLKTIPEKRLENDTSGRKWFTESIGYDKTFKVQDLREVTDREDLNSDYTGRYKVKDVKGRKGISAVKIEISALYSFNKCFVQRYKGRLQYYRDDLSQKGKRNMVVIKQALGAFQEFKKNLD